MLGPQRQIPNVATVLRLLGCADGPVCTVTAGWQEREGELHDLEEHIATRALDLAPRYAVLAGAGHLDYRDYQGFGGNHVPPVMIGTADGLYAADGVFGDVVGDDGVPEIAIGRLPVLSARSSFALFGSGFEPRSRVQIRAGAYLVA